MPKKRPCSEYPNCECPKCEAFRKTLDVIFTWDRPGMGAPEAKDRPLVRKGGAPGSRKRKRNNGVGQYAWARAMRLLPCHYCGQPSGTIDHITPRSQGGKSQPENCVPACNPCNSFRGSKPYKEFKNGGWLERLSNEARYNVGDA